jgi:capsular exopolysaccharide synthesis family protein
MADEFAAPALDISLRDYVDLVRRRRAVIIQAFIAVVAGGFAITLTEKPTYRSTTRILVEGKSFSVAQYDANNPLSGLFLQDNGHEIATQIEVIQGEQVLMDAFDDAGIPRGSGHVTVSAVPGTDIIDIAVDSNAPANAEQLAKALPKTYLRYVNGNRKTEIASALKFAQDRLKDENRRLYNAQMKLQQVRQISRIYSVEDDRKSRSAEAASAGADLHKAEVNLAGTRAQLDALIAQRRALPPYIDTPTSTTNPDIATIRASIAALKTQRVALSVLFKPTSPKVEVIDAQIMDLQARLAASPKNLVTTTRKPNEAVPELDRKIETARVDLANLTATYAAAQAHAQNAERAMLAFNSNEVKQSQLEAVVENAKSNLALLTKTEEDLNLRNKATHDPVTIVSPASRAVKTGPRQMQTLAFAAVAGLILGFCLALLQEYLDDRVNSPEDVRGILPVPTLGFVPLVERESRRILTTGSDGSILECYRVLRSNVRFATVDAPHSSLLVSSAVPEEGKSVTAVNLAIALALDGVRVILVDLDLRRPTIHKKLNLAQSPGVTNVLVGHTALDDAIQSTDIPGLRVLAAGPLPPNPAELLNSQAMQILHRELKNRADVIVMDSPPFLATADAQVLSAMVDGMIYVVHLGGVKKAAVRHVRSLMEQAHGKVLGVVFNKIDLSANRDDYYYGYYRYYSEYQQEGHAKRRRASTAEFDNLMAQVPAGDSEAVATTSNGRGPSGSAGHEDEEKLD